MKTIETTVYSASELKQSFPESFKHALTHWQNSQDEIFWQDEIIESLKAVFEKCNGVRLKDWSLGAYSRNNYVTVSFSQDGAADLNGARAMAWLENNLLSGLRVQWAGANRKAFAKYGSFYRAGLIKPCPLTGYCADEDYLDSLRSDIKKGYSLKESFENLAGVCQKLLESEAEDQASEDYFLNHADANDFQFTEDGELF